MGLDFGLLFGEFFDAAAVSMQFSPGLVAHRFGPWSARWRLCGIFSRFGGPGAWALVCPSPQAVLYEIKKEAPKGENKAIKPKKAIIEGNEAPKGQKLQNGAGPGAVKFFMWDIKKTSYF